MCIFVLWNDKTDELIMYLGQAGIMIYTTINAMFRAKYWREGISVNSFDSLAVV